MCVCVCVCVYVRVLCMCVSIHTHVHPCIYLGVEGLVTHTGPTHQVNTHKNPPITNTRREISHKNLREHQTRIFFFLLKMTLGSTHRVTNRKKNSSPLHMLQETTIELTLAKLTMSDFYRAGFVFSSSALLIELTFSMLIELTFSKLPIPVEMTVAKCTV